MTLITDSASSASRARHAASFRLFRIAVSRGTPVAWWNRKERLLD
jgi:hypothetical protein